MVMWRSENKLRLKLLHYNITLSLYNFELRHPRCVWNKSNYNVYAYIVKTQIYIRW